MAWVISGAPGPPDPVQIIIMKKELPRNEAVALTQISVYSMHKNLGVRQIMEVMRKRVSVSTSVKQNMTQTITDHIESTHRLRRTYYFAESGAFEMRHSFLYFFSLVRISEFVYANFSSTCIRCTHLLKS